MVGKKARLLKLKIFIGGNEPVEARLDFLIGKIRHIAATDN
jgi:hypothetical protein